MVLDARLISVTVGQLGVRLQHVALRREVAECAAGLLHLVPRQVHDLGIRPRIGWQRVGINGAACRYTGPVEQQRVWRARDPLLRFFQRRIAAHADLERMPITWVESKRAELQAVQPAARQSARILSMLPKAAAMYRQQIKDGLDGDPRAAAKARLILRDLLGPITLTPGKKGELWASYRLTPAALVKATGAFSGT